MFDWNIVSGVATLYRFAKEILQDVKEILQDTNPKPLTIATGENEQQFEEESNNLYERYQVLLGRRHKFLREKILKLNPREISDFYEFEKVSFLEDCEAGIDELPTDSVQRFIDTFFIEPKYLQEGKYPIFKKFDIIYSQDNCKEYLSKGFTSKFLCDPDFQETGFVYLAFYKKEKEIWRTISSNTVGSFHSNGGGARNIYNFIYAMLELHYDPYISFVDVAPKEWESLKDSSWYNKGMLGYSGKANHHASDMFDDWVESAKKAYKNK